MNELKSLLSYGNKKLGNNIAIFNMQSATNCTSKKLGLCKVCNICYAKKAEYLYPSVLPYRKRQEIYWKQTNPDNFVCDFLDAIKNKKTKIKYLRFSESGDFETQNDLNKLVYIANKLKNYGIITYVYSARSDLDYSNIGNLKVNGSGFTVTNNFLAVKDLPDNLKINEKICKGNCRLCNICATAKNKTIYVKYH